MLFKNYLIISPSCPSVQEKSHDIRKQEFNPDTEYLMEQLFVNKVEIYNLVLSKKYA